MYIKILQSSEENIFLGVVNCQDAGPELVTVSEKSVQRRCFAVKFMKFLKTASSRTMRTAAFGRSKTFLEINILEIETHYRRYKLQQSHGDVNALKKRF